MGKTSVAGIAQSYAATLRNARTQELMVRDVLCQIAAPTALGVVGFVAGWHISDPSNIVVGISIVAALMCAMAVLLFQARVQIRQDGDPLLVGDDVRLVDETFDDVMWAILVGFVIVLYLVIVDAFGVFGGGGFLESALSAILVILIAHFVMVVAMCLKRLRAAYDKVAAIRE